MRVRCVFYNLWHCSLTKRIVLKMRWTRFTCYLTLQCWLQPSQADKELNLPAQSLTVCELIVLWTTYSGLFTTREEWNGHGLFGGFIFVPSCRHQKDPRFISPASGFSQWLAVWAFKGLGWTNDISTRIHRARQAMPTGQLQNKMPLGFCCLCSVPFCPYLISLKTCS